MIDREKVIKGLEHCDFGDYGPCYEKECPYYQSGCTEKLKNDILALLKKQDIGDWINVKDGLPKPSKMVLFTGKTCYGTWSIAQRGWYDGAFWHRDTEETIYSSTPVSYWMPLPEPPEENET